MKRYGFKPKWLKNPKQKEINDYLGAINKLAAEFKRIGNGKRLVMFVFYAGFGVV